jgi:UDP-N-acetylglucosamine 2-epimerase (non-hydrolysing)
MSRPERAQSTIQRTVRHSPLTTHHSRPKLMVVMGTRPEAIKLAPVVQRLQRDPSSLSTVVVATAQHRDMLDQVLRFFEVTTDYDLDLMRPSQTLEDVTVRSLREVGRCLDREEPSLVVVQGDTTTTMAAGLSAYYRRIPVAHVEAGLRTHDLSNPYPEELNRRVVSLVGALHLAPTSLAAQNLVQEGVEPGSVLVTGNPVIDALYQVRDAVRKDPGRYAEGLDRLRGEVVLVTAHRRESFGDPLTGICRGVLELVGRHADVEVVYPVHPNPNVREAVHRLLSGHPRIHLLPPVEYGTLVWLLDRCRLVLTDSGGIQEEAPALGKPFLVLRQKTERPEAVQAGAGFLVGTDPDLIAQEALRLLGDQDLYRAMASVGSPYGDGRAAERIDKGLRWFLGLRDVRPDEFEYGGAR